MNAKELASLLNGREYGSEITKEEEAQAKAAGDLPVDPFGPEDALAAAVGAGGAE